MGRPQHRPAPRAESPMQAQSKTKEAHRCEARGEATATAMVPLDVIRPQWSRMDPGRDQD
jgi:hypothetical protein